MSNPNKAYIIQNKITKEMFHARSGKTSWKAPGHAKNAFNQSWWRSQDVEAAGMKMIPDPSRYSPDRMRTPLFSEQDVYEIIELKHGTLSKLEEAVELLKYLQGRCGYSENIMINKFLEDYEK